MEDVKSSSRSKRIDTRINIDMCTFYIVREIEMQLDLDLHSGACKQNRHTFDRP